MLTNFISSATDDIRFPTAGAAAPREFDQGSEIAIIRRNTKASETVEERVDIYDRAREIYYRARRTYHSRPANIL